ncbi:MAG: TonB-dependent receptor plug domain-containing protein [Candidatus Electronema sp. VV]
MNFNDGYGLVLIDGQRVMGCGQSGGMGEYGVGLNQLPVVDMIERIEVVKGPSSALYGSDALAGVVNITSLRTPRTSLAARLVLRMAEREGQQRRQHQPAQR